MIKAFILLILIFLVGQGWISGSVVLPLWPPPGRESRFYPDLSLRILPIKSRLLAGEKYGLFYGKDRLDHRRRTALGEYDLLMTYREDRLEEGVILFGGTPCRVLHFTYGRVFPFGERMNDITVCDGRGHELFSMTPPGRFRLLSGE